LDGGADLQRRPRDQEDQRRDWWAEAGTLGGAVLCAMLAVSQATPHGTLWLVLLAPAGLLAVAWSRLAGSRPVISLLSGAEVGRGRDIQSPMRRAGDRVSARADAGLTAGERNAITEALTKVRANLGDDDLDDGSDAS
jgi:hypothetical protein